MDCARHRISALMASWMLLLCSGCSTLGLSLYPSTSMLTKEAKAVADASRIPMAIPRENAKSVLPPHKLQPGDALLVEPANFERDLRLPADQIVLADGTVDLGPFGRIVVAGRSLEEAESLIEQQIVYQSRKQKTDCVEFAMNDTESSASAGPVPDECDGIVINVRLLEPVHQFYVLGEVNAPGSYPLTGSETVLDAIVNAGGLTSSANPCQILLARPTDPCECRVTLPVCYREIVQMGNTATNYQLQPGDRVFVASRSCLDELMFWRASKSCPRCAGCNRACAHPEAVMAKQMPIVQETMIAPGSAGMIQTSESTIGSFNLGESPSGDAPTKPMEVSDNPTVTIASPTPVLQPDADGELEFAP
ncbi:MAG: SLBB domain-containing protein [Planctomycetota bacterium]